MVDPIRIGNCSGFYGDRLSAARELIEGGPLDVLTGDYLAELTMALLWKSKQRHADGGYAASFVTQFDQIIKQCLERGIKIVVNAGGLAPEALSKVLRERAAERGVLPEIAIVTGDDLMPELEQHHLASGGFPHFDDARPLPPHARVLTANAYLGGFGIAAALRRGADVVITGRVTDAALVIGPAVWRFDWARDDWDRLAGALVAGHVIECGTQCTGGNYPFYREISGLARIGFPIAEIADDGSAIITKHAGTGGAVTVGTVTAQLLYEIGGPHYENPDVIARFDTIALEEVAPDRVLISGVRGQPPPPDLKVNLTLAGGFRNSVTFKLSGLDLDEKATLVEHSFWHAVGGRGEFRETSVDRIGTEVEDPPTNASAISLLRITALDDDEGRVGKRFTRAAVELALSSVPGLSLGAPPGDATPVAVTWPSRLAASAVRERVRVGTEVIDIPPPPSSNGAGVGAAAKTMFPPAAGSATRRVPLGRVLGARSGDKGGNANLGVWARTDAAFGWMVVFLDTERLRALLPETQGLGIERYVLPNLRAVNFVIRGLLGDGVASSTRLDPQAKTLAEYFRAKHADVPEGLLSDEVSR